MTTISENLQTLADSTAAIKQAIIDKGGEITGDITTWADAISGLSGGGSEFKKFTLSYTEFLFENDMTWSDFVNSIYNIKHFILPAYTSDKIAIYENKVYDGINRVPLSTSSSAYIPILATDKIISNGEYYYYSMSGGGGN